MTAYDVSRTLVKSQPEVWAELEQTERLAELFGDDAITITRAEPESTIEWKGSNAEGTIEISGSGWGTKVRLTAEVAAVEAPEAVEPEPVDELVTEEVVAEEVVAAVVEAEVEEQMEATEPSEEPKPKFLARFKAMFASKADVEVVEEIEPVEEEPELMSEPEPEPELEPEPEPEPDPEPEPVDEVPAAETPDFEARLTAVLDHLGSAHKRPFVNAG